MTQTLCRSEEQALSQLETIQLWHEVSEWASREGEPCELPIGHRRWLMQEMDWGYDPDHDAVVDGIRDLVTEDPLSVQVRSDWHDLGGTPEDAWMPALQSWAPRSSCSPAEHDDCRSPLQCRLGSDASRHHLDDEPH